MGKIEDLVELNKHILARMSQLVVGRDPIDTTAALSSSFPYIVDSSRRRRLYLFSPTAFTLSLADLGTLSVLPNTWTDITFPSGYRLYAQGVSVNAPLFVFIRATDEIMGQQAGSAIPVDGTGQVMKTSTAASSTSDVLPPMDVLGYKEVAFQFSNGDNNFVEFLCSNINPPPVVWPHFSAVSTDNFNTAILQNFTNHAVASDNRLYVAPISFRFLRLSYTGSTTPTVTIWLSKEPGLSKVIQTFTSLGSGFYGIGYLWNWGNTITDIAAGVATDTVISLSQLGVVSFVSAGTNGLQIFDATAGNPIPGGSPLAVAFPAAQPLGPVQILMQFNNSIVVKGNVNNPAVRLLYANKANA